MSRNIRLYVDHPLDRGQQVSLNQDQAHYLFGVMRLRVGQSVSLFNGQDGEWSAVVVDAAKRKGRLEVEVQTAPLRMPPDLWLLFAPIKKARTDFIVEKAAEMGAAQIWPVTTAYTNFDRIKRERLQAHAMEAAEQCGGTYVPDVLEPEKLEKVLDGWDPARKILFCDESMVGEPAGLLDASAGDTTGPWAILIGPEGGFSPDERQRLLGLPFAYPISLGPRILRADTAAVAALTLWQSRLGDWG